VGYCINLKLGLGSPNYLQNTQRRLLVRGSMIGGDERRSSSSNTSSSPGLRPLRKFLLLAWFAVCFHIWYAADDENELFDTHRVDRSFADPQLNGQNNRLDGSEVDGKVWQSEKFDDVAEIDDVDDDDGEEELIVNAKIIDEVVLYNDNNNDKEADDEIKDEEETMNQDNIVKSDGIGDYRGKNRDAKYYYNRNNDDNEEDVDDDEDQQQEGETMEEVIIEALKPITFNSCCLPAAFINTNNPTDVDCFGTCYSDRACNDTTYPFNSIEEKRLFPSVKMTSEYREKLRAGCMSPERLTPPIQWCQKPQSRRDSTKKKKDGGMFAQLAKGIPPAGCSQLTHGAGSGPFQHVIIFPSSKLAFCGIPKVGITMWEQFLRFYIGAKDYPSLPHYKLDRTPFQYDQLDPLAQRRIWEDDEWTWATFIRNPAERLLSGYLDKVHKNEANFNWTDGELTFETFVDVLSRSVNLTATYDSKGNIKTHKCTNIGKTLRDGLTWCSDPHWRPQVFSCGISERIDRFKYIGDIEFAADQSRELLSHVDMWESYGKHFINGGVQHGRSPYCNLASYPANHTEHVGFQQKDEVDTNYAHAKKSKEKMDIYYTPELLRKVNELLYPHDYKLWTLVNGNGNKLSNGDVLMSKLSSKCRKPKS